MRLERLSDGVHLYWVSDWCACAVALDVVGPRKVQPGALVCFSHDLFLLLAAWEGDAVCPAAPVYFFWLVLVARDMCIKIPVSGRDLRVGGSAPNDSTDWVPVPQRSREPLDINSTNTLGAPITIGRSIKRMAGSRRRKHAALGRSNVHLGRQDHVGTGNDDTVAVLGLHGVEGLVQRVDGRGAGRVDGEAGPVQVKDVADAVGHVGRAGAGGDVAVDIVRVAGHHGLVVDREVGDEDTGRRACEAAHCPRNMR